MNYLFEQDFVKTSSGIGVVGMSKAAEIALLMGTYFDDKVCLLAKWHSDQIVMSKIPQNC